MAQAGEGPRIFQPGQRFLQYPWMIEKFLGAGASGEVYAARHLYTGDLCALKVGHLEERASATRIAQHLAEAVATYRIQHQNVVRVFDVACEPDGMVWQMMELCDGSSLEELLARHGRLTPLYAIALVMEAAFGLHEAHEHQIIHRDVHPGNLFVTREGVVKLLDFSLAKVIPAGIETTREHRARGTVHYMAPEHLMKGAPTPQFDVFALGVVLWQSLAGRLPFEGTTNVMTLVERQHREEPESLVTAAGVPAYLDDAVRGAIAKDPARRYGGMWAMVQALRDAEEKLLADPAAALLRERALWERKNPIAQNPDGHGLYRPPRSLPRDSPAPAIPSRRIVVSPAVKRAVAPTVPMALPAPTHGGATGGPTPQAPPIAAPAPPASMDAGAPTVRARPRPPRRWGTWALLLIASGLIGAGAALWVELGGDPPAAAKAPSPAGRR